MPLPVQAPTRPSPDDSHGWSNVDSQQSKIERPKRRFHPKLEPRNPKPETRNPKLETRNPRIAQRFQLTALTSSPPAVYPTVRVRGGPHERGHSYGRQAAPRILYTLAYYRRLFEWYAGLDWQRVTDYALRYAPIVADYDRSLTEEMQGIADGAAVSFEDILALNVRTEVMYGLGDLHAAECTAFAALPEATTTGHTLLGQNWDWHPDAARSCVVLQMAPDNGPAMTTVVEAGLLAKLGMNDQGIGLVTNALVSDVDHGDPGVPYHVLLRSILACASFGEAVDLVYSARRASSANYLIASSTGQAVDLEAAPGDADRVFALAPNHGTLAHANCFVAENLTVGDETRRLRPLSQARQRIMEAHLGSSVQELTVERMQEVLRDHDNHPQSMCRHPVDSVHPMDRSATVVSAVMDLDAGEIWLADGQPCSHPYRRISVGAEA